MPTVRITGYRRGLQKVAMTKTIRLRSGLNLAAAKTCTDSVLDGAMVTVDVPTSHDAEALVEELVSLGAVAEVV
jgi:ribosomal protein L7/L12